MSVPSAYLGVIIIWSTTPLAILWSSEEVGFVFGVTSRMLIGAILALVVAALLGSGLQWHRRAKMAYMTSGFGIYGGMITVYWSAQFIPTGWISVIFGISPIITAIMARMWLDSEQLTRSRLTGMLMGLSGLVVIFATSFSLHEHAALGVIGMLVSVAVHCASAVWIKRIDAEVPAIVMTSGGLLFAAPLFLLTWILSGASLPDEALSTRTAGSIAYLALLGSVLGFALYYYVLSKVEATRVALLTLVTPVCALGLGNILNNEPLTVEIIIGSLLILSGLATFEFSAKANRIKARLLRY
ncbi:putative amino-acid metabolite efflux pump [Mariprofundus micogutta]|uniref:Putative amino-acid metabolite efflux pump n=1 Tax=Mariprofundus micogutta TaxID=1921010 RepID=A0A1L8CQL8_9PROT|nr:DMT family transporter [Mariprofundus micogutta]GAV21210.1 putative amino-acid metabolite efflux pump [Mariprofundus micogutta]